MKPSPTQQYLPLVDTVFWVEAQFWRDSTLGPHLVNVFLHFACALLLFGIVRSLGVPGGWLAAAIFALHPVHVESVAWLVELKNTLSGLFFFSAVLLYLRCDRTRSFPLYLSVLLLFVLGLLAKPVVAIFPAVMLLLLWWRHGTIEGRRHLLPLLPFFVVALAAGLAASWMEKHFSGATGPVFDLSFGQRVLIAGRAFWFYLGKLVWPADLVLIYPRWGIDLRSWWQYLFPAAAFLLFAGLWIFRRRVPGLFVGFVIFLVALLPTLGFFNVAYFRFSFVADHFQYLASAGLIVPFAAGLSTLAAGLSLGRRLAGAALPLLVLGTLTWRHSEHFRDAKTAFLSVLARNPDSALAHNNLGQELAREGRGAEAMEHFQEAVRLDPESESARYNYAQTLLDARQTDEAIGHLRQVVAMRPNHAEAAFLLANALAGRGDGAEARAAYEQVLKANPRFAGAATNLGNLLFASGDLDGALSRYNQALAMDPGNPTAHYNVGAVAMKKGDLTRAIIEFEETLRLQPDYPDVNYFLANALLQRGRWKDAVPHWEKALALQPDNADAANSLAWVFSTSRDPLVRNGEKAVIVVERTMKSFGKDNPMLWRTLAAAYAESGRFGDAVDAARHALELVRGHPDAEAFGSVLRSDVELYRKNQPLREPMR